MSLLSITARVSTGTAIAVVMAGCGAGTLRPRMPPVVRNNETRATARAQYDAVVTRYNQAIDSGQAARARLVRNRAVNLVLAEIEDPYREFENVLFANHAGFQIGADVLELSLATVATLSNGERGKTILSAILSGVTGVRLSIDKNLFRQQTVQAVIAAMRANRDRLRTRIASRLQADDVDGYPLDAARADLVELFFAGTLQGALQELHQKASAEAEAQRRNLDRVLVAPVTTQNLVDAAALRAAIPVAFRTADGVGRIRKFLAAAGVPNTAAMSAQQLETAYRDLANRMAEDAELREKAITAAREAELIK